MHGQEDSSASRLRVGLETVAPRVASLWGGPIFLGSIGLAFVAVYLAHREDWWAVIRGGVLLTLAAVAGVSGYGGGRHERITTSASILLSVADHR